jgi:ABC-type phosphate transport system ATPase subunit
MREDESVYEVSAETYSDSFESLVGSVKTGKKVKIEMKINKLSNYLEQVNINGQIQLNDEDDFERVIYFSKYNQSKILTPPTAND